MKSNEIKQSTQYASHHGTRYLDLGVKVIASIILGGLVVSAVGFLSPKVNEFLLPRFGAIGLILGANPLIFLYSWRKNPTRTNLLIASFMTTTIGLLNGYLLLKIGTVDVVKNIYIDRIHSSWAWSAATYLFAGVYMAYVAFRYKKDSLQPTYQSQI